jgi:DNA-3-methyladenine glycosylase I
LEESQIIRCSWCGTAELYTKYHDEEWGKPTTNEQVLFEFLILEAAQAGLSWITILRRRENYRKAFANFNPIKVAQFTPEDAARLMQDAGIIRNRLKIESAISTARIFLEMQKEFGSFHNYLSQFFPEGKPMINEVKAGEMLQPTSEISDKISKDLKKRGVKFMGSTICYAYLQAVGLVNDHISNCSFRF